LRMSSEAGDKLRHTVGLCATCRFMRTMESDRGSTFYLCQLSATDPNFPKYPRLPVLRCSGYQPFRHDQKDSAQ
jgi:hypothetical protein